MLRVSQLLQEASWFQGIAGFDGVYDWARPLAGLRGGCTLTPVPLTERLLL
jgi:hypothetical protein